VPARVTPAEDGKLAFILPSTSLQPGTSYVLTIQNVSDENQNLLPTTVIRFTTAGELEEPDQEWIPTAANLQGNWYSGTGLSPWQKLPPLAAPRGVTAISGQALRLDGKPLVSTRLSVDGVNAKTDSTGRFLLSGVPAGKQVLLIDGSAASRGNVQYGRYEVAIQIQPGQTNVLNYTIWMTMLDVSHAVTIPSPTPSETVIATPRIPGLELHLPANTMIVDQEGRRVTQLSITAIPVDKPPFPLPPGVRVPTYFTIQPGGAVISIAGSETSKTGAWLVYPNAYGMAAGTAFNFWHYDAGGQAWSISGQGRVDSSGTRVVPNPKIYLNGFTARMVGSPSPGPGTFPTPGSGKDGDPVDLSSGLFVYSKTDFAISDTIPISLTRYYRPNDTLSRNFGVGTTDSLNIYMIGDTFPYTYQELVLPDGTRIRFNRTSPGTSYPDAVYEHTATATSWYGATLTYNTSFLPGVSWILRTRNGTQYCFPDSYSDSNQGQQAVVYIQDRNGNTMTFARSSSGELTQVTSPNGRYIRFAYDSQNRVTSATDNIGRTVQYAYDANGNLATVTDANNGVTSYTYDSNHNMLTVKDPRNIVFLTNQYDASGRVIKQTQADGTTYSFSWTPSGNTAQLWTEVSTSSSPGMVNRYSTTDSQGYTGLISSVDITDPRGYIRHVTFNAYGFTAADTHAVNQPEQQTNTYQYYADNLRKSVTDPLGRTTFFDYDANGNTTLVTLLSGTSGAINYTATYSANFEQIASATDPLNHTSVFSYDSSGNLLAVTDPLNNQTTFTYDGSGNPLTAADPLHNISSFTWLSGDLISEADPLGNTTSQFHDYAGRTLSNTDPLGNRSLFQYDALNEILSATDARNGVTQLQYDGNGNTLSLTDALGHATQYTYDPMDRVSKVTDALNRSGTRTYDQNGNANSVTDRKGQVTLIGYDGLNRATSIGFNATTTGSTTSYESTVALTYDAGNRLTSIVDSTGGTIARTFDNLDRLTQETTPQGTVTYGYDAAGRRTSMQASGQAAIAYTWDNDNRLLLIKQGTKSVQFTYDAAGRRSALTLPNAIVASYGYDAASRLTGIIYTLGTTTLGNLQYGYDAASRRVSVGGSLANTLLPSSIAGATYDAANQVSTWNGTAFSYDPNGDLLSDGQNTYSWNTRGQLTGITGGSTAAFVYDGLGRRTSKRIGGTSTGFLYDGIDAVQEQFAGGVTANLLIGGVDEFFERTDATSDVVPLTDALGSVLSLTNPSGSIGAQYTYSPFGATSIQGGPNGNSREFTGRENDGTGLYYYRARYYGPQLQRFISEDPLAAGSGNTNSFLYVSDSPANGIDPTGLTTVPGAIGVIAYSAIHQGLEDASQYRLTGNNWNDVPAVEAAYFRGVFTGAVGAVLGIAIEAVSGNPFYGGLAAQGGTTALENLFQGKEQFDSNDILNIGFAGAAAGIAKLVPGGDIVQAIAGNLVSECGKQAVGALTGRKPHWSRCVAVF
jgi:RHS repeat-associated protein